MILLFVYIHVDKLCIVHCRTQKAEYSGIATKDEYGYSMNTSFQKTQPRVNVLHKTSQTKTREDWLQLRKISALKV